MLLYQFFLLDSNYIYHIETRAQFGIYIDVTISEAVEVTVCIFTFIILQYVGRRTIVVTYLCGTVFCSIVPIILRSINQPMLTEISDWIDIIARSPSVGGLVVQSVFLVELFPIVVRDRGIALAGFTSKIGQIIAPFVVIGNCGTRWYVQYIVFAAIAAISLFLVLLLPETAGYRNVFFFDEACPNCFIS